MKMKKIFSAWLIFCCFLPALGSVSGAPLPSQKPFSPSADIPEKRSEDFNTPDKQETDDAETAKAQKSEPSEDGADPAQPPLPKRAPAPSLRKPKIAAEKLGPPAPPEKWHEKLILDAKKDCAQLISEKDYEFETVEAFKEGVCGAPAPIILKALNLTPKVQIEPAPKLTCPLADAVKRWIAEVVQPQAKALLKDDIVSLKNMASYHCRTRYNDPTQRMSHHAFANALDISEFITAKGERISLTEHWDADDARSKFLKEIHSGACKIFGTVLGPEANDAHKSHFHFDMAKRRFSSYCQ